MTLFTQNLSNLILTLFWLIFVCFSVDHRSCHMATLSAVRITQKDRAQQICRMCEIANWGQLVKCARPQSSRCPLSLASMCGPSQRPRIAMRVLCGVSLGVHVAVSVSPKVIHVFAFAYIYPLCNCFQTHIPSELWLHLLSCSFGFPLCDHARQLFARFQFSY